MRGSRNLSIRRESAHFAPGLAELNQTESMAPPYVLSEETPDVRDQLLLTLATGWHSALARRPGGVVEEAEGELELGGGVKGPWFSKDGRGETIDEECGDRGRTGDYARVQSSLTTAERLPETDDAHPTQTTKERLPRKQQRSL